MTGLQKAAVLLVSLGPDHASKILRHLRDEEIEILSLEMAKLRRAPAGAAQRVLDELVGTVLAHDSIAAGGVDFAREVLERAVGPARAAEIVGRLTTVIERRPFEFLRRTPPEQIVTSLRHESPQTTALVIANLHPALAAQTLAHLTEEDQATVAERIALMGETAPDVVRQIEQVVRDKMSMVVHQPVTDVGGVKALAEILNSVDRSTERNVLDALEDIDEELAADVRRLLFTFDDLVTLDDRSIQLVLREADHKDLALALRGVGDTVKDRILANMSERGAQMLIEEIAYQPPQRKRIIEEAQGRIVAIIRRLEDAGDLVIKRGAEEDAVL